MLAPIGALLLAACSACPRGEHRALLEVADVLELANAALRSSGINPSDYGTPEPHFEFVAADCTWSVFYEHVGPSVTVDSGLLVLVNDTTREVEVHGQP